MSLIALVLAPLAHGRAHLVRMHGPLGQAGQHGEGERVAHLPAAASHLLGLDYSIAEYLNREYSSQGTRPWVRRMVTEALALRPGSRSSGWTPGTCVPAWCALTPVEQPFLLVRGRPLRTVSKGLSHPFASAIGDGPKYPSDPIAGLRVASEIFGLSPNSRACARRSGVSAVLDYLPKGNTLSDEEWHRRHRLLQWLLAAAPAGPVRLRRAPRLRAERRRRDAGAAAGLPDHRAPHAVPAAGRLVHHARAGLLLGRAGRLLGRRDRGALPLLHHHRLHRALPGLGAVPARTSCSRCSATGSAPASCRT